jgi:hypothetical protein
MAFNFLKLYFFTLENFNIFYFKIFHLMVAYFLIFILILLWHIFWVHIFHFINMTNIESSFEKSIMSPY